MLDQTTPNEIFPPAMRNMGMPDEMASVNNLPDFGEEKAPVLEITQPLDFGEPKEVREIGSVTVI